jgi:hypothetical protein
MLEFLINAPLKTRSLSKSATLSQQAKHFKLQIKTMIKNIDSYDGKTTNEPYDIFLNIVYDKFKQIKNTLKIEDIGEELAKIFEIPTSKTNNINKLFLVARFLEIVMREKDINRLSNMIVRYNCEKSQANLNDIVNYFYLIIMTVKQQYVSEEEMNDCSYDGFGALMNKNIDYIRGDIKIQDNMTSSDIKNLNSMMIEIRRLGDEVKKRDLIILNLTETLDKLKEYIDNDDNDSNVQKIIPKKRLISKSGLFDYENDSNNVDDINTEPDNSTILGFATDTVSINKIKPTYLSFDDSFGDDLKDDKQNNQSDSYNEEESGENNCDDHDKQELDEDYEENQEEDEDQEEYDEDQEDCEDHTVENNEINNTKTDDYLNELLGTDYFNDIQKTNNWFEDDNDSINGNNNDSINGNNNSDSKDDEHQFSSYMQNNEDAVYFTEDDIFG